MPLNYWQLYGNYPHMPDLRTTIVHSTRTSTLNGFGRHWRANNHNFILRSKLNRKSTGKRPTFRNMAASTYFTKERFSDVSPSETMYDKHNKRLIPYANRKSKESFQRQSLHKVYRNFSSLDSKKKMQYHNATPMRYTNSQQFEDFKKPQLRRN